MEAAFPIKFCRGIRTFWRRRRYQRLDGSPGRRRGSPLRVARLGGGSGSPTTGIRLRPASLKLKLRPLQTGAVAALSWVSPVRFLVRLRDAYMNAMLGLAGKSGGRITGKAAAPAPPANSVWARRMPKARSMKESSRDFERKLIIEIYKSVAASQRVEASWPAI